MKTIYSPDDLFAAMRTNGPAYVKLCGREGILQSVEREDGSGRKFNVKLLDQEPFFVGFVEVPHKSEPTFEYVYRDGTPFDTSKCAMPDNTTCTYTLRVRALHPVAPETIKAMIQTKYEVVEIVETHRRVVVANGK